MNETTYGPGGFDPSHPNGNIIEQVVDNGDGTGTRTTYDDDGTVTETATVTGLPVPPVAPVDPQPLAVIAAIGDALSTITPTSTSTQLRAALLATRTAIDSAIGA